MATQKPDDGSDLGDPLDVAGDDPEQRGIEQRLATVRAQWLLAHPGRRGPLSLVDVFEIAQALLTHNVHPTVESIRRVNGDRGSPNVIHPALKTFYASGECQRRMVRTEPSPGVPARVVEIWSELLGIAETQHQAAHRSQLLQLDQQRAGLEAQWAALEKEQQLVRDRLEAAAQIEAELRARIATLEASERHARESAATHRSLFEQQQHSLSLREQEVTELRAAVSSKDQALALAEQRHDATETAHKRELAHTEDRLTTVRTQSSQLEAQIQDLQLQLSEGRAAIDAARARADGYLQEATVGRIDLADARRELETALVAAAERDTLRARCEDLTSQVAESRKQLDLRGSDITQHVRRIAQLEGQLHGLEILAPELERAREEIERLRRTTDLLRQPPAVMAQLEKIQKLLEAALASK